VNGGAAVVVLEVAAVFAGPYTWWKRRGC